MRVRLRCRNRPPDIRWADPSKQTAIGRTRRAGRISLAQKKRSTLPIGTRPTFWRIGWSMMRSTICKGWATGPSRKRCQPRHRPKNQRLGWLMMSRNATHLISTPCVCVRTNRAQIASLDMNRPFFREAGDGPGVICFHSNCSSSGQFKSLMSALADGHHVFAVDSYGAGKTPAWDRPERLSLADEVALVRRQRV